MSDDAAMPEIAWIIAVVGLIFLVVMVIRNGQRVKSIVLGPMSVSLDTSSDFKRPSLVVFSVPDGVAYMNASLRLGGRLVSEFSFSEEGGHDVGRDVRFPTDGPEFYELSVSGTRRAFNAQGAPILTDFRSRGSGEINLVHGGRYVVREFFVPVPGGVQSSYEMCDAVDAELPPDDIQEEAARQMILGED